MKKILNVCILLFLLCLTILTMTSCKKKVDWSFTKKDASKFVELSAVLSINEDDTLTMNVSYDEPIFNEKLDKTTILLFDISGFEDVDNYIKYDDVKDMLIEPTSINYNGPSDSMSLTFNGNSEDEYGIIIHKSALTLDTFAAGFTKSLVKASSEIITEYEEQIIKKKGTWDDANKTIQIGSCITQVVLGVMTDNPVAFAGGLFGIVQTLGPSFFGKQATIASVSKQLEVVDQKIDFLTAQIDTNQKQILDEFVRTQAMIDEVKVNLYNQNITAYQTDYIKPLDDYIFIYKDSVEQALKAFVNSSKSVDVYYKTESNKKTLLYKTENDISGAETFTYTIDNFPNAKEFLTKNKDIIGDGFAVALEKDIKAALNGKTLPSGVSIDDVTDDVYRTIADNINFEVLSRKNETLHRDVLQYISNFIAYARALAGINVESVITSYISRLEYIYNFTYETKSLVRDLLASLKLKLNYYVCIAQSACIAQKINSTKEISDAYDAACNYIEAQYNYQNSRPDNYSFAIKSNIKCSLYSASCEVSFTNLGNSPVFHSSFILKNNLTYDLNSVKGDIVNVGSLSFVDYSSLRAIVTRYNLLKSSGSIKNMIFINYLNSVNIVSSKDMQTLNSLLNSGRTLNGKGKILTSYAIRDLNNNDSFKMTCTACGNTDGYYFRVGQSFNYRYTDSNAEAEYWSGKIAYGDIVDGETGVLDSNKKVSAYAKYSESHWYWSDDEHWGFVDDIFGNFLYILTKN